MKTSPASTHTRREFCAHACQAVSLVTLGSILQGCGGSPTSPSSAPALPAATGTIVNGALAVNIDANAALSSVGSAAIVSASGRDFLVARTAQDTFRVFTAVCTHEGCTVDRFQNQTFVCPCHGSEYNTSGMVVKGPAANPLREFTASLVGSVLTIAI